MANTGQENHPVWVVYDRLRSARLSVKYYGCQLHRVERLNFWLDIIVMAAAPSSAIAGWALWNEPTGKQAWQVLAGVAGIVAFVKPLLSLPKKIKEYESILTGYRTLEYDLIELKGQIEQKRRYDAPLQTEFRKAQQRERALIAKTPEARENERLKRRCQEEVLRELPVTSFFVPAEV
jgi:hypothetical protein